ncbi:Hypothetical protein A7982_02210 [Minicystis rosea]|nr:Hypothetical protein A7982_02210 [Minicystis rosea]
MTLENDARLRAEIVGLEARHRPGIITVHDDARAAFTPYLSVMHVRVHAPYAEEVLKMLDKVPRGGRLREDLAASLEIVLAKDTGALLRTDVIRTSGFVGFDEAAVAAVRRAAPFGPVPDVLASPDGNVYLLWEFRRDPVDTCATRNAYFFSVKPSPKR